MRGRFLGKSVSIAIWGVIVVPGVGVQRRILVEPVSGAVETVTSALADDVHLPAGRAQECNVFVGNFRAKLINAFHSNGNDGLLGSTARDDVIGDIDAVHDDAVLIATGAGNGAAVVAKAHLIAVIGSGTGLKRQQFTSVAAQGGKPSNLSAADHISNCGVGSLKLGDGSRANLDDFLA